MFRVQGVGFGVQGSGFRVFRVRDSGFRAQGSVFRVKVSRSRRNTPAAPARNAIGHEDGHEGGHAGDENVIRGC